MPPELQRAYAEHRFDDVVRLARELGAAINSHAEALMLAANAAIRSNALPDADHWLTLLRNGHQDNPALQRVHANVLNRLGVIAGDDGQHERARTLLQRALAVDAQNMTAQFNLALEWRRCGRDDAAVPLLIALQDADPQDEAVNLNLAECHAFSGNTTAVADLMDTQSVSGFSERSRWRRVALDALVDDHWPALLQGESDAQSGADITVAAALARIEQGQRDAAVLIAEAGIAAYAGVPPMFRCTLAAKLHPGSIMDSSGVIDAERARWQSSFAEIALRDLRSISPALSQLSWSNFALGYHGRNDLALQSAYGDWLCAAARQMRPDLRPDLRPRGDRKARVILVSSHWRHCTVGHYFQSWVGALASSAELDVMVVAIGPHFDDLTHSIGAQGATMHRLDGDVDADHIAEALLGLAPDLILYPELGMDVRLLPVAALRLAPVQVMAWGHPVTSGLPTIDAYISCADMEPPGAQAHYRERLQLLPGIGTRYTPPQRPHIGSRAELGLHPGPLVVVPQSGVKIHPDNDCIYRDLLDAAPTTHLLFFENESTQVTQRLRARLANTLPASSMRRVAFHPLCSREQFLRVVGSCNLMLDCVHWSGGNTALDALRMGTPILTTPGDFMRGRQCAAMLRQLGLEDELTATPEQLAARAAALLSSDQLPVLRRQIDARFERLLEGDVALSALRQIVIRLLDESSKVLPSSQFPVSGGN